MELLADLMDDAFAGAGLEASSESQSLLADLTTVTDEAWRGRVPGTSGTIEAIALHVGACKVLYANDASRIARAHVGKPRDSPSVAPLPPGAVARDYTALLNDDVIDVGGSRPSESLADWVAWIMSFGTRASPPTTSTSRMSPSAVPTSWGCPCASATGSDELAVAADGQALYLAGSDGVTTVSTGALLAVGQVLRTTPLAGIAITPDGLWLYGVAAVGTGIVELAITGPGVASSATVPFVDIATKDRMPIRLGLRYGLSAKVQAALGAAGPPPRR